MRIPNVAQVVRNFAARTRKKIATLPEPIATRLVPGTLGYRLADIPPPITAPAAAVRLLIAPANYAAQGVAWSRAVNKLDGIAAVNLAVTRGEHFDFDADYSVSENIAAVSTRWGLAHWEAVRDGFTHVLIEAQRPVLGVQFGADVRREAKTLRDAGIRVAYVSHGSDLRLPSLHAPLDTWSPFNDADWPLVPQLERLSALSKEFLREQAAPVFVVTPELLLDYPEAAWLPNVVDPARWANNVAVLEGKRPVVLHAPTNTVIKGSGLIEPVATKLGRSGAIDYVRAGYVPPAEMPALYRSADIVLEQFRLGIYSTTAIEAMASGRLVVAHLSDQVRSHIESTTGMQIPIVEATPDTLEHILLDVVRRPDHYREIARSGPAFVHEVHDGRFAARVLEPFLRSQEEWPTPRRGG